jgi:CheY-like chemotaxis protein
VKHILVVDDDALLLSLVSRALPDYRLTVARDPAEALALASRAVSIDLVITDYLMPSMTGDELLGRLREAHPTVKALIMTGYAQVLEDELPEWWHSEAHLSKPFKVDALREAVINLIGLPA